MKSLALLCGTTVVALAMTACNQAPAAATTPPDTHDADLKAISDTEAEWNREFASRDADKILARYVDDAVAVVTGMEAMKGKDAIKTGIDAMLADKAMTLTF